jgi:hypothetical protein
MMNKSENILHLIEHLQRKFGERNIVVCDHWSVDSDAIGFTNTSGKQLAYISIHDEDDRYYLALEDPPTDGKFPYTPAGDFDRLTLEQLEQKVARHLQV